MRQDYRPVDGDCSNASAQLCWMFLPQDHRRPGPRIRAFWTAPTDRPIPKQVPVAWPWAADPEGNHGRGVGFAFIKRRTCFPGTEGLASPQGKTGRPSPAWWRDGVLEDAYNYMKSGQLVRQVVNKISGRRFQQSRRGAKQLWRQSTNTILTDLPKAPAMAGEYYTPRAVTAFHGRSASTPHPGENPVRSRLR